MKQKRVSFKLEQCRMFVNAEYLWIHATLVAVKLNVPIFHSCSWRVLLSCTETIVHN